MSDVSRETQLQLDRYADLLRQWTRKISLVSRASLPELETRHIADSLQIADIPSEAHEWCDLGSGGGFPGLVVAIARPDIHVTLIEVDQRKSAFLRHVVRDLGLDATVVNRRIEEAAPCNADVISARALAPLTDLIDLSLPHARPDSTFVFLKGAKHDQEIAAARERYSFHIDVRPSRTDNEGVILVLENIARV